jgi:hypothetical protein
MTASLTLIHLEEGVVPELKSSVQTLSGSSINTILATYKVRGGAIEETDELTPVDDTPQAALVLLLGNEYSTHGTSTFSRHKVLVFVQPCTACVSRDLNPLLA